MFRRFTTDESGNFGVIAGLLAVSLIGSLGGALDLSYQWSSQTIVQRAVDAAALAGAKAVEAGTEKEAQQAIQIAGQANLPDGFANVDFIGTFDADRGTVTVDARGDIAPAFLKLLDIDRLSIGASAQALIQRKTYIDVYFLLDVSESMNIAATPEDRKKLEDLTSKTSKFGPCAFACHVIDTNVAPIPVYDLNQQQGKDKARLRIDVLREAATSMVDEILKQNTEPGSLKSIRIATAGFGATFVPGVGPTTNASALKTSIASLAGNDHTFMDNAFNGFRAQIGEQGTGRTANDPRKLAIVVTDGIRDTSRFFSPSGLGPLDPALCDTIKSKGISLAVLEIKYVKSPGNWFFDTRVAPYYDSISPNLKLCASGGLYYQASDATDAEAQLMTATEDLLTVRRRLSR